MNNQTAGGRANFDFFKRRPYGVLMAAQMILPLSIFVVSLFTSFHFVGMGFVVSMALFLFVSSFVINAIHLFGWNRQSYEVVNGMHLFIPATFLLFIFSSLSTLAFIFSTLICLIGFFDSLRYYLLLMLCYFILSALCAATTYVCGQLTVLLFRAMPNNQVFGLLTTIIEGDKTTRTDRDPQFTPATTPSGPYSPPAGSNFI
ncbi:hypothetical protein WR25_16834 [Diploscapter pachys]|uniref:MARVEL domain-containing protein n=1 Tax=Diploscapter pachys TaxID=2018661 RepID=A0A2A2LYF6_9BILA|nr:hypothetical protein WR25_16834 [Diploscapter pachys]